MRHRAFHKAIFCSLLCVVILLPVAAVAQTNVSGLISTNTTWTLTSSPYIVTGNTLVNNGVTLTIEPGVMVKFDTTKVLQIDGELIAIGTAQNRITFTASDSTPVRGSWGRIQFSHTATDAVFDSLGNYESGSVMKYCDIRYAGGVTDYSVYCDTTAPYFSHCRISDCRKHGICFVRVVGRVDSSSIQNCGGTAIFYVPISADLIVKNDTFILTGGGIQRLINTSFASITIQSCIFNYSDVAINLASSGNSLIANNTFESNSIAIAFGSSGNNTFIKDNVFNENSRGIQGSLGANATISDNVFIGNTNGAIGTINCNSAYSSVVSATNLIITNNYFENNTTAIIVYATPYSVLQGNTFLRNHYGYIPAIDPYCFLGDYGLIRFFSGRGIITDNVFDGNFPETNSYLVRVSEQWEISNNHVRNNSSGLFTFNGVANLCSNRFVNNIGPIISSNGSSAGPMIHDNEFLNNSGTGGNVIYALNNNSIISNNVFNGNSTTSAIISISGGAPNLYNNIFFNNVNSGINPIISVINSSAIIRNNDFGNNQGTVCLRLSGNMQPLVSQNNFVNPGVQYEIENLIPFSATNLNVPNNYWGTSSAAHIDSVIKDFFDDGSLSIVSYSPVLTSPAFIDTAGLCPGDPVSLSGAVLTETGLPIPGVTVTLSGNDTLIVTTDTTGRYNFTVTYSGNYTIAPSKNNDVVINNGVTLTDVLLMRRHIIGTPLNSPYKIIAAAEVSADGDTTVNTQDVLLARSLILGNITSFPSNRLWQFVSSDYVFPDAQHPFPFDKTRTYTNITTNQTGQDFIGIKLGDVNGNWDGGTP